MDSTKSSDTPAPSIRAALDAQQAVSDAVHRTTKPDWIHLDLSMGQLKALVALAAQDKTNDGVNISALAETLGAGKPKTSILVDQLVQLGYVRRTEDSEDRRRTLVTLTDAGNEQVTRLQLGKSELMIHWLEQMNADDLAALTRGLNALAAILERELDTAPSEAITSR